MTSLAATKADVFLLGGALLACPAALDRGGERRLEADHVHVGHVRVEGAASASAGPAANDVLSVTPLLDPADPKNASNPAMKLYKAQVAKYKPKADTDDGIVATAGRPAALLVKTLESGEEARPGVGDGSGAHVART